MNSGTLSPNPWDLTLSRQNGWLTLEELERRTGLRRDATRAPIQRPEWQGAASMPRLSHRNNSDPPDISKLMAKNGLDNGVHFSIQLSEETGNRDYLAELLRMKGQILNMIDARRVAESQELFAKAAVVAAEQGAISQQIQALSSSMTLMVGTKKERESPKPLNAVTSNVPSKETSGEVALARQMLKSRSINRLSEVVMERWQRLLLRT